MPDHQALPATWRRLPAVETAAPIPGSTTIGPFGSNLVAADYRSAGVPVVFVRDVRETGFEWRSDVYLEPRKANDLAAHGVEPGDLLATKMGLPPCIAAEYPSWMPPGVVTADIIRLRPNRELADVRWLVCVVNSSDVQAQVRAITGGVTRPKVTLRDFRGLQLPMPPLPEQRRIAEILDTVDEAIRKTEQIITKLERVKQGLLHDLLTRGIDDNGELRDPDRHPEKFKDSPLGRIPKAWEPAELGDLVSTSRPIVYGILMPGQGHPDGVPVVKVKDIKNGVIASDGLLLTSPAIDYEYRRSRLREGDLLFTIRGTVGRTAFVPARLHEANITQDTARIGLVRGNPDFVREYLSMPRPRAFIETHTIGVAVKGINLGDVRRIPVALPPQVEADEIASRLLAHRQRIEIERGEVSKLRLVKQGLMEDLLTGRVRVTALLDETPE